MIYEFLSQTFRRNEMKTAFNLLSILRKEKS